MVFSLKSQVPARLIAGLMHSPSCPVLELFSTLGKVISDASNWSPWNTRTKRGVHLNQDKPMESQSMSSSNDPNTPPPVLLRSDADGIATLTLNRPAQYNALSEELLNSLQHELDEIAQDETLRPRFPPFPQRMPKSP